MKATDTINSSVLDDEYGNSCQLDDIRFTASLYASTTVDERGDPDEEDLCDQFRSLVIEWQPDKDPYWCCNCDVEFRDWDHVGDHLG